MKICIKNVVKNITMAAFPERCRGCGATEGFLCGCCKKYISEKAKARRVEGFLTEEFFRGEGYSDNLKRGSAARVEAEYLGFRDEILGEIVEECKYTPVRGLSAEIAGVVYAAYFRDFGNRGGGNLNRRVLKNSCVKTSADFIEDDPPLVVVPMPTSRKHVRERGFDHMDLICREIERLSGGSVRRVRLLERAKDTVQVGASLEVRKRQAKEAVRLNPKYLENGEILAEFREAKVVVVDDVWTTGASLTEAGKMLSRAGVSDLTLLAFTKNRPRRRPVIRHGEID